MKKYLAVFVTDWQSQFIYRTNFILWRIRNVLRLLMTYFLYSGIFTSSISLFSYNRPQIIAYVFLVLIVQSIVLSAPSAENIGGEIANGDLSNFLVKPMSYLKYWFVRDLSSKLLNILFAAGEIFVLWVFLKPDLELSITPVVLVAFFISCIISIIIFYFLNLSARSITFWAPEYTWGLGFLILVFLEIFSGMIFPLDILPATGRTLFELTPFPYLIYYPISILIGKTSGIDLVRIIFQSLIWMLITYRLSIYLWHWGLKVYSSEGK
jgi:ABC-2 type transport system permease protein